MGRNKKNNSNKYKKLSGKTQKPSKHQCRTADHNIWEKHFSSFQSKMLEYDLFLKDIKGDGNCLFRAIADQLDGNEGDYKKYREQAVEQLKEDEEFFANFIPDDMKFDKYLSIVSTDGVWGGNIEIQALSKALGVNFVIHMTDRAPMIISNEHDDPLIDEKGNFKFIHLAYHYGENIGEHYSSVRNLNDTDGPAASVNFSLLEKIAQGNFNNNDLSEEGGGEREENEEEGEEEKKEDYFPKKKKEESFKFKGDEEHKLKEKMEKLEISEEKNIKKGVKKIDKNDYPRNKKCYCGSAKAFKNCCLNKKEDVSKTEETKENGEKKNKHLLVLV